MRLVRVCSVALAVFPLACASAPTAGPLGEGAAFHPRIVSVDTTHPPRDAWIEMDQPGYAAILLVAPGHSATLLYPPDSLTDNRLTAATHHIPLKVPDVLVQIDSSRNPDRSGLGVGRQRRDTSLLNPGGQRMDTTLRARGARASAPISPTTPTYLLLVTSPKPLVYQRIIEKTAGVSIPLVDTEALNAVAKAIKATIASEPRDWAGFYQRVELRRRR